MSTNANQKSCLKTLCFSIAWFLIHVCPIVGQIRGLYILCNHDTHLGSDKTSDASIAHASLFLASYGIGYILVYAIYYFAKYYKNGWTFGLENRSSILGFLCLTFVTLFTYWIFLLGECYVNSWKYGLKNIKKDQTDQTIRFWEGYCVLMCVTLGLYVLWLLGGGYIDLWEMGLENIKDDKKDNNERFFKGHCVLTLVTFGLYVYVYLWQTGLANIKDDQQNNFARFFKGRCILTLVTFGLYIVYQILKWYFKAWEWGV